MPCRQAGGGREREDPGKDDAAKPSETKREGESGGQVTVQVRDQKKMHSR